VNVSISSGQREKVTAATIEPEGAISTNGIVTVFYRMRTEGPNGNQIRDVIHSWVNDGASWKIVSGMCRNDLSK
jgi:hypothetical protein